MKESSVQHGYGHGRRRFLIGLTAVAVVGAIPCRSGLVRAELAACLGHFFREGLDAALVVGRGYLATLASRPTASDLATLVFGAVPVGASVDVGSLIARVRERRNQDFLDGSLVTVDGWLLAATEARLCALAVLATGP